MAPWTGFFSSSGSPALRVSAYGVVPQAAQEFDAIVDTGFTGFISMPLVRAFPLALVLSGITSVVLADGSVSPMLIAIGVARVAGETQSGLILLDATSSEVLLGMDFLRRFRKALLVYPVSRQVSLMDDPPPAPTGPAPPETLPGIVSPPGP